MKASLFTMMVTTMATALAAAETVNFDDMKVGAPPPGWTATQTGSGSAKWSVEKDDSAPSKPNVLKQSGVATFPVCIKDDTSLKDGFVEVKFKPVSGKEDQAGGVIWRAKDANNYYIARANALEGNVVLYKTVNGKRSSLDILGRKGGYGVKIDKDMGVNTWAAFAGSDDNAVVDGDFAVTEDELQPVLKSLLKDKINIVAIHQHMTHEEPRIMFFHYWGRGPAKDLAHAVEGGFLVGGLLKVSSPLQ